MKGFADQKQSISTIYENSIAQSSNAFNATQKNCLFNIQTALRSV
jgi:hypothetical protein